MTFIDWSDFEGMIELLKEYILDEKKECGSDPTRYQFLSELLHEIGSLAEGSDQIKPHFTRKKLQTIYDSIDPEFRDDPVSVHIKDCIAELDRANGTAPPTGPGHDEEEGSE